MCAPVALVTQNFGNLASRPEEPVYQIYNGNVGDIRKVVTGSIGEREGGGEGGNRNLVETQVTKVVKSACEIFPLPLPPPRKSREEAYG